MGNERTLYSCMQRNIKRNWSMGARKMEMWKKMDEQKKKLKDVMNKDEMKSAIK